jgi:hypothetical protein
MPVIQYFVGFYLFCLGIFVGLLIFRLHQDKEDKNNVNNP